MTKLRTNMDKVSEQDFDRYVQLNADSSATTNPKIGITTVYYNKIGVPVARKFEYKFAGKYFYIAVPCKPTGGRLPGAGRKKKAEPSKEYKVQINKKVNDIVRSKFGKLSKALEHIANKISEGHEL